MVCCGISIHSSHLARANACASLAPIDSTSGAGVLVSATYISSITLCCPCAYDKDWIFTSITPLRTSKPRDASQDLDQRIGAGGAGQCRALLWRQLASILVARYQLVRQYENQNYRDRRKLCDF